MKRKILIIGNGIAGLAAAVRSVSCENQVVIVAPTEAERTESVMAMGGINAVLDYDNDSYIKHYNDTISSGYELNNKNAVMSMVTNGPRIIGWLKQIGTNFNTENDGTISLRKFGGQSNKRTIYADNSTGKQIMTAIIREARKYEEKGYIIFKKGYYFLALILAEDNKECIGASFLTRENNIVNIYADITIIATGGPNGVFGKTTGSILNTGCVVGKLLRQGVQLENLEMIQFHPTTINANSKRIVISESARSMGGKLYTLKEGQPWYFMKEWYPEMGELMQRDIVSKSIYKVCDELGYCIGKNKGVYLDLTDIDKEIIGTKLVDVEKSCKKYLNIDITSEPILVYPEIHYFMGGIKTDEHHRTNIKRLYAIGECSSQYHGAGRLGGNSLLGALNGAFVVSEEYNTQRPIKNVVADYESYLAVCKTSNENINKILNSIDSKSTKIIKEALGIVREEKQLLNALEKIRDLKRKCIGVNSSDGFYRYYILINKLYLAEAFILSAIERKESRGAHCRKDFPTLMKDAKNTIVTYNNGKIEVRLE